MSIIESVVYGQIPDILATRILKKKIKQKPEKFISDEEHGEVNNESNHASEHLVASWNKDPGVEIKHWNLRHYATMAEGQETNAIRVLATSKALHIELLKSLDKHLKVGRAWEEWIEDFED